MYELFGGKPKNHRIMENNIYMFCLPHSIHCMRGHEALKELAKKCNATMPLHLKSTKLRKLVITVSQLLNLSESDFNALCKHMGHNPNVHREYYQMDEETIYKKLKLVKYFYLWRRVMLPKPGGKPQRNTCGDRSR